MSYRTLLTHVTMDRGEWVLGGVTHDLIADARQYVLLCH
jgi:hypothetical protein